MRGTQRTISYRVNASRAASFIEREMSSRIGSLKRKMFQSPGDPITDILYFNGYPHFDDRIL